MVDITSGSLVRYPFIGQVGMRDSQCILSGEQTADALFHVRCVSYSYSRMKENRK